MDLNENAQDAQNDINVNNYDKLIVSDLSSIKKMNNETNFPFEFNESIRKSVLNRSPLKRQSKSKISVNRQMIEDFR